MTSLVSAGDTSKTYNSINKIISISDSESKPLADFQLIYNTFSCSDNCFAIIKATIKQRSSDVLTKIDFQDIKSKGDLKELSKD